jgi:diaminopimelate epimerase
MNLNFQKYQGTGNDFIIVNNLHGDWDNLDDGLINFLCDRNFGIGGDGLIKINKSKDFDFEMDYYNSDGTKSFCGNGARCAVTFVKENIIEKNQYIFSAIDGVHKASISNNLVSLKMSNAICNFVQNGDHILNTGSPHYVRYVDALDNLDVFQEGRKIRFSESFKSEGINVNFVERLSSHSIAIRTYERGVEDETLSCGTGATASAIVNALVEDLFGSQSIKVGVKGGELEVAFNRISQSEFEDISLIGPALKVFEGIIDLKK